MTYFAPREFDMSDKHEEALVGVLGSRAGMILADCTFNHSSRDEKYYLLALPGEDGPDFVGANVAFPWDRPYVNVMPIVGADEATRKHYASDRYGFYEHMAHDQAVIEELGGRAVDPARIWFQGMAGQGGLEDFHVVRINDTDNEDEARRMIVMHVVTANPGDEMELAVLMDVGLSSLREWLQDEFEVAFAGRAIRP